MPGLPAPSRPLGLTYSRISDPGDTREASLDSQEEAAVALLESLGFHVPAEYRFREQFSGMESIYDRPVLAVCRKLVASSKVQAWGCYHTDRLAREPKELITIVADNAKHDVVTKFVKLGGDFKGRFGEAVLYMAGMASAVEWDQIRDRTMRGRQEILDAGQWLGGGPVRYGYQFDLATRSRTAHPETAPIVRRIFEMCSAGMGSQQVALKLNEEGVPSPQAFRNTKRKDGRPTFWCCTVIQNLIKEKTYLDTAAARRDGSRQEAAAQRHADRGAALRRRTGSGCPTPRLSHW